VVRVVASITSQCWLILVRLRRVEFLLGYIIRLHLSIVLVCINLVLTYICSIVILISSIPSFLSDDLILRWVHCIPSVGTRLVHHIKLASLSWVGIDRSDSILVWLGYNFLNWFERRRLRLLSPKTSTVVGEFLVLWVVPGDILEGIVFIWCTTHCGVLVEVGFDCALAGDLLSCFHVVDVGWRLEDVLPTYYCVSLLCLFNHCLQVLLGSNHDWPGRVAFYAFIEETIGLIEVSATALLSGNLVILLLVRKLVESAIGMLMEGRVLINSNRPV
jgi:hypothetical protein